MPRSPEDQLRREKPKWILALALLGLLTTAAIWVMRPPASPSLVENPVVPAVVSRTNLLLFAGRLCLSGQTNAFTGLMIEHAADGSLRSRSSISNGLLHGLSEGWRTNGQLQVTEHFKEGTSHGLRTKWYVDGTKLSEAVITDGQLHGPFRRWHENGALAEEVELNYGQPDGMAKAYFPNGFMKSRTTFRNGKVIEQRMWKDGENKEPSPETTMTARSAEFR